MGQMTVYTFGVRDVDETKADGRPNAYRVSHGDPQERAVQPVDVGMVFRAQLEDDAPMPQPKVLAQDEALGINVVQAVGSLWRLATKNDPWRKKWWFAVPVGGTLDIHTPVFETKNQAAWALHLDIAKGVSNG